MKLHQTYLFLQKKSNRNSLRLEKAIPKVETETKPSTLQKQLEKPLQLEKRLLKSEGLESVSLKSQTLFVKLLKLDFEKYSGDVLRFQEFWNNFSSALHENKRLPDVEKLNYLRAEIEGNAKRVIAGLKITNDNYEVAVKILRDRFGDHQTVISGHYTKVMDLQTSMYRTIALCSTFDELEKHLSCDWRGHKPSTFCIINCVEVAQRGCY